MTYPRNLTSGQEVPGTQNLIQSDQIRLAQVAINEGIAQFKTTNENNLYEIQMRCQVGCLTGQVKVMKAGLWVHLENLTRLEIPYRIGLGTQMINSSTELFENRILIDLNQFTAPLFYFQTTATTMAGTQILS